MSSPAVIEYEDDALFGCRMGGTPSPTWALSLLLGLGALRRQRTGQGRDA